MTQVAEERTLVEVVVGKLDDLKERLIVIETEMRRVGSLENDLKATTKTANDADASTKSAHKRLDKMEENQQWLKRTMLGGFITFGFSLALGLILFVLNLLNK